MPWLVQLTLACAFILSLLAIIVTLRSVRQTIQGAAAIETLELRGVTCSVARQWAGVLCRRGEATESTKILDNVSIAVRRGQLAVMRACSQPFRCRV